MDGGPDAGIARSHCCSFGSPIQWCVDGLTATGKGSHTVAAGDAIGVAETLTVQLSRVPGYRPPAFVRPGGIAQDWLGYWAPSIRDTLGGRD